MKIFTFDFLFMQFVFNLANKDMSLLTPIYYNVYGILNNIILLSLIALVVINTQKGNSYDCLK
jgi:hypothetical protein